jgi:hypothetical protein
MIEAIIAIVIVTLVVFLTVRKKKSADRAIFAPAPTAQPVKPAVAEEVKEPVVAAKPVVETVAAVTVAPEKPACCHNHVLPQDSVLNRHYLHYVQTMVTELHSASSSADIATKVAESVASEAALQQLIQAYETRPKATTEPVSVQATETATPVAEIVEPVVATVTPAKVVRIPEDSVLRRHHLTQLHALAAARLPARPSDSVLRRHYDALLSQEVKKQLSAG